MPGCVEELSDLKLQTRYPLRPYLELEGDKTPQTWKKYFMGRSLNCYLVLVHTLLGPGRLLRRRPQHPRHCHF